MAGNVIRFPIEICRADSFVRFLGVFRLGLIDPGLCRHVFVTVIAPDYCPAGSDRFASDLYAIGPHVCDQANGFATNIYAFIKALRDLHCLLGREPQLT